MILENENLQPEEKRDLKKVLDVDLSKANIEQNPKTERLKHLIAIMKARRDKNGG